MRMFLIVAAVAVASAVPGQAAVNVVATNVDFTAAPVSIGITSTDRFEFSFNGSDFFNPVLVRTTGNAAVPLIFGQPSPTFTDPGRTATFGPGYFPAFGSVPTATTVPFSIVPGDLGLRYTVGGDDFYGYARFANGVIESAAFETLANTPIMGGALAAVPEPASWAMMIGGIGMVGATIRRRRRAAPALLAA